MNTPYAVGILNAAVLEKRSFMGLDTSGHLERSPVQPLQDAPMRPQPLISPPAASPNPQSAIPVAYYE